MPKPSIDSSPDLRHDLTAASTQRSGAPSAQHRATPTRRIGAASNRQHEHTHTHTGIASGQREEHEVEPARRPARPKREEVEKAVRAARLLKALIQRHGHGKLELRSSASAANEMVTGCLDADSMIRDFARRATRPSGELGYSACAEHSDQIVAR